MSLSIHIDECSIHSDYFFRVSGSESDMSLFRTIVDSFGNLVGSDTIVIGGIAENSELVKASRNFLTNNLHLNIVEEGIY